MMRVLIMMLALTGIASAEETYAPIRVELLAQTFIPSEHEEFGTIGGLSGATHIGGGEFDVVSDADDATNLYSMRTRLRGPIEGDGYALDAEIMAVRALEHASRDCEAYIGVADPCHFPWAYAVYEKPPTLAFNERSAELPPELIAHARPNRGFESLCVVRDRGAGTKVWAAMEAAIAIDGPIATQEGGTLCRVLEFSLSCGPTLERQMMYRTEPKPPGLNIKHSLHTLVDMTSLPDGRVLALERSFDGPYGYNAQLFVLDGTTHEAEYSTFPVLNKQHVLTFSDLGLVALGNLEGMAVGPELGELLDDPEERGYLLLVVADDNFGKDHQKNGSQVLALRLVMGDDE